MSLINISNLTFGYDGSYENVFENVSLRLDTDWKLGFTGRNGRGKTTFLKLLMGKYEYSGSISSSVEFDYFPFEISDKSMFGLDIAEETDYDFEYWRLAKELNMIGLCEEILYRPFDTLSYGERTKLMLAILFMKQNNFLLIDEPTNHLDTDGREAVSRYLDSKRGFILVSHDRRFMDNCIDHILSVNRANIELQQGNFSSWLENKKLQDEFEMNENAKLQKEIFKLNQAAKRSAAWADKTEKGKYRNNNKNSEGFFDRGFVGHKAAKAMKRSKNIEVRREKASEEKSKLLKNIENNESLKIYPLTFGKTLAEIKDLEIKYEDRTVNKPVSFSIKDGQRILLRGVNGSGKSSILKAVACGNMNFNGSVCKGSGLIISYIPQDASFLKGRVSDFASGNEADETLLKTILRKMDFPRSCFDNLMENFSEGQKKKVLLAASLCKKAHLYIWDEPLNYIDVFSRIQIETLINEFKPAMLLVEHDSEFAENIGAEIIALQRA